MSDIFAEVKAVVADVLKVNPDEIKSETRFIEDLKADSMDLFFLIDGFSEKFNVTISEKDAPEIKTVGDVVRFIEGHQ
jgi:acyl carrier protein